MTRRGCRLRLCAPFGDEFVVSEQQSVFHFFEWAVCQVAFGDEAAV